MQDTSSHCHHRSSKMSNARGNPGHAVGTTAIAWRGSMVWQGFRRRWLGPDPAVGHAVCCAVRCKMKGNCWVTVQIEDIVHRRLKEYIYIYTQSFLIFGWHSQTSTQAPITTTLQFLFWVADLLLLCCRLCSFLQHERQRFAVEIEDINTNGHARNQRSINCAAWTYVHVSETRQPAKTIHKA